MRTLTLRADLGTIDHEKTVPFPSGISRGDLIRELLYEIEDEWGGTVEEYEVSVKESLDD